jgi:hypothetical protein
VGTIDVHPRTHREPIGDASPFPASARLCAGSALRDFGSVHVWAAVRARGDQDIIAHRSDAAVPPY